MYFFNILEPKFICEKAIRVLKQLKAEQTMENYLKIQELGKLQYDYYKLIKQLEDLGDFGVQQMEKIAKSGERKGECIF